MIKKRNNALYGYYAAEIVKVFANIRIFASKKQNTLYFILKTTKPAEIKGGFYV